jgi:hypothetical protein
MIEKHWRGVTPRTICDFFWDEVNKHDQKYVRFRILSVSYPKETRYFYFVFLYFEFTFDILFFLGNATNHCYFQILSCEYIS